MGIDLAWDDQARKLSLRLAEGSRMRPPLDRKLEVQRVAEKHTVPSGSPGRRSRSDVLK